MDRVAPGIQNVGDVEPATVRMRGVSSPRPTTPSIYGQSPSWRLRSGSSHDSGAGAAQREAHSHENDRRVVAETDRAHDLWAEPMAAVGAVYGGGAGTAQRGMSRACGCQNDRRVVAETVRTHDLWAEPVTAEERVVAR
jgi:hypothetical protein